MDDISGIDLVGLQRKSLDIAEYFGDFCQEHDLLFYCCGGCCIGALRHKGFIPWDDDVDFFMPRNDYEKLKILWPEKAEPQYVLECSHQNATYGNLFLTIRDKETTLIKPYQQELDICHGVALDVLPLDGYPPKNIQRKVQVFWALIYSLYCSQIVPENHGKGAAFLGKLGLKLIPSQKLRYKIWRYAEKKMTKYSIDDPKVDSITELCSGPYYMQKKYPKEAFESAIFIDFEDTKMPIPVGYDTYLRLAFGNYMELPPVEKRTPHHDAVFMDLEHSYTQYKGIYYCKK
ncbi:MAG: LicD family protein [Bacillota bacterium]|nr:LicD family protein [Bacillota bacterium]